MEPAARAAAPKLVDDLRGRRSGQSAVLAFVEAPRRAYGYPLLLELVEHLARRAVLEPVA